MDNIYGCKWYVKCIWNIYKPDGILLVFDSFSIGCIVQDGIRGILACDVGGDEADHSGDDVDDEIVIDFAVGIIRDVGADVAPNVGSLVRSPCGSMVKGVKNFSSTFKFYHLLSHCGHHGYHSIQ